jgi:uncharacterized protein YbjQ (UPF0145 family)
LGNHALITTFQGVLTVQKPFTYALLLAAMLGLAACDKTPEDNMESAKESASEAMESMGDAADKTGDAIEKKADEVMGTEPTYGEEVEEAANDAVDAMEDAGEEMKDAVDGQ